MFEAQSELFNLVYIDGFPGVDRSYKPILDSPALKERFSQEIAPRIETIMLFQEPLKKELKIYTEEITRTLKGTSWQQEASGSDEMDKIRKFIS